MKSIKKLSKKTLAVILSVAVILVSLPLMLIPILAADSEDARVVDPSTFNSWQHLFPADNTTQAGRIWTDKSVFKNTSAFEDLVDAAGNDFTLSMLDKDNNFLVALSALASNKSIVGYSYTPTDTMLVLDISGSMSTSNYVDELVVAANNAITELLALNNYNRVGVVLYSDTANATVMLPLDRYTPIASGTNRGKFLNNSGQSSIQVLNGVKNSNGVNMNDDNDWINVVGGTYIQSGIYAAMEEFLDQTETVIPEGQFQEGTARTPIFVVMSDGLVTYGTNNYAAQNNNQWQSGIRGHNIGNGQSNQNSTVRTVMDFVTQLTAAYAWHEVDEHYQGSEPLFYTLGLGSQGNSLNSAPLNPSAHNSTDELWEDYLDTSVDSSLFVSLGNSYTSIKRIAEINDIAQLDYVEKFFPASNANGLITAFDSIVKQIIIQSLYYPTLVDNGSHDHDGFVEFIDDIGHYMDVKDIKGIMLGNQFFTGEYLAQNFNEEGKSVFYNSDGSYSDLGNNLVWSVKERIGIDDVVVARDLINSAYNSYQLRSWDGGWSNYIGWYADEDGSFMGHWHEGHTEADIPENNGVKAAYINKSYGMLGAITGDYTETDLMYISTQIHTRISDGKVSVIWRVPASLIPVITYDISLEGDSLEDAQNVQIDYKEAEPIRLVFEVGLDDEITQVNVNSIVKDKEAHIIDENNDKLSDDGKYYFYTNWWSDDNLTHENPSKTEDTIVLFEPSIQNERYYYAESTPIYINNGTEQNPNYQLYKSATMPNATDGNTYFRKYAVIEGKGTYTDGLENADIVWYYEEMSEGTIGALTSECRKSDNSWEVPAGTIHRVLEPYNLPKSENTTASLLYVRYPVIAEGSEAGKFYIGSLLGNNGRISMDIPQGIKLTKTVDDSLFGTTETFTFEVEGPLSDLIASTIYHEDVNGVLTEIDSEISTGKLELKIKAGESVYILGLEPESSITVKEIINGDYEVSKITVDGQDHRIVANSLSTSIVAEKLIEIEFENTLVVNDGTIVVSKEVIHDSNIPYNNDHEFEFEVYPKDDYAARVTFKIKAGQSHTLSGLHEGIYIVNEIESSLPAGFKPQQNMVEVTAQNAVAVNAHFVNNYTPDAVKPALVVSGTKTLNGRAWQSGDEFEFVLEMQDGVAWNAVGNSRKVSYSSASKDYKFDFANDADLQNFEFTKVGTYWFRVREHIPSDDDKLGGVTYDEIVRYFSVTVTDATMDGKLEVSAVNANAPATVRHANNIYTVDVDFTNTYAPIGSDGIIITVNKKLDDEAGTNKGKDGYIFGIYTEDGSTLIIQSDPTNASGNTQFNLSFPASAAGNTYNFKVKEIKPDDALVGMNYDATAYDLKITVIDNLDGTISAKVVLDSSTSDTTSFGFTNVYDPADVDVVIEGNKVLEGRDLEADEFTFELYKEGQATAVDTDTNAANGDFAFQKLTFDKVGTYNYTVKEQKGTLGGIDYDTKTYAVKIVVSDDADNDGKLDYVVYVDNNATTNIKNAIKFVNVYSTEEASVTLKATKSLTGRDLIDGEFKFDLYTANDDFSLNQLIDNDKLVVKKDAKSGIVSFTTQTFGAVGTYRFVILEDEVNGEGITVDTHKYEITVIVTDNGNGKLVAEIKVDGVTVTGDIEDAIVFNNTYRVEPITATIEAFKVLSGKNLTANEFTFALYENGVEIDTAKNAANGKVEFDAITYNTAGTYVYTVKEVAGNSQYITYDKKEYTVTVTIADNAGKGYFDKTVVYSLGGSTVERAEFENVYTPDDAEIIITAKKDLKGRDINNGEFTFELYEDGTLIDTKKNNANGMVIFDALNFDDIGTYNYTVKEVQGNLGGVEYSTKVYAIKVVVSSDADLDGYYDYKLYVDNVETNIADIASQLVFENIYTAKSVKVTLKATKKLLGRDLVDGEFKFDLYEAGPNFALLEVLDDNFKLVKVDNATGTITFSEMTFSEVGTYRFVILEDELDGKGITTDKHKFEIEVIVTDNGEGQLLAEVKVDGKTVNDNFEEAIVFNNAYTITPTDITIEADKDLKGNDLKGDDFTFELYDKDGRLIESVKNDKDGKILFSKLNIKEAGTYVYTIKELNGGAKGYTYDTTVYTVTVTVKDGGEGIFVVDIVYSDENGTVEKAVFENTYTYQAPQTNDLNNISVWFMLMIISGGLALALASFRKKKTA